MDIIINDSVCPVTEDCTLQTLSEQLVWPAAGVAVAVNARMVPRGEWASTVLHEGDRLVVITAACGG